MNFQDVLKQDIANIMIGEFSEAFDLVAVDGTEKVVRGILSGMSDQVMVEPGYADTNTLGTSDVEYPQPKPGDRLIDSKGVEWIVGEGARLNHGLWSIPVKSDRRVRV